MWTRAWDQLGPMIPTFTPGGYHSFEHRWALAEAFDFQAGLGREKVAERITCWPHGSKTAWRRWTTCGS